jgi:curved DNA-binding protein CbpA
MFDGKKTPKQLISDRIVESIHAARLVYLLYVTDQFLIVSRPKPEESPQASKPVGMDEKTSTPEATKKDISAASYKTSETTETAIDEEAQGTIREALLKMEGKDYYQILGIDPKASEKDIEIAFLTLKAKYHPILYRGGKLRVTEDDSRRLLYQINRAYLVLMDTIKRKQYDRELLPSEVPSSAPASGLQADLPSIPEPIGGADESNTRKIEADLVFREGLKYLRHGHSRRAVELFRRAAQLAPEESQYLSHLIWSEYVASSADQKQSVRAIPRLSEVLKNNEADYTAHYFLGRIFAMEQDFDSARLHFEKVLEIQPGNVDAQREVRLLESRSRKKKTSLLDILTRDLFKK